MRSLEFGWKNDCKTSKPCSKLSTMPFLPKTSQVLTVWSQELLVSIPLVGLKWRLETGAVCPFKISISYPVFKLHTNTLKGSLDPAHTISPEDSIAKHVSWVCLFGFKVLKFLYLTKSNALTVPSEEDVKIAFPFLGINLISVIAPSWSLKVVKQREFLVVQHLTFPSSPPVARYTPSGE